MIYYLIIKKNSILAPLFGPEYINPAENPDNSCRFRLTGIGQMQTTSPN